MQISGNTVLVTGGASGIGRAIAERFLAAGSSVLVCGRREEKLLELRAKHPGIQVHACDLASEAGREELLAWATRTAPRLNVLVNNAGVQNRLGIAEAQWGRMREELAINLDAPIHLTRLFLPDLAKQERPAILNVTSGLAFVPLAGVPVYCATKAALRSFTLSLRHQVKDAGVEVVEIIPPAVDTDLGGPGLHTFGVNVDGFADHLFARLAAGDLEIAYGFSAQSSRASREELDAMFARMNAPRA